MNRRHVVGAVVCLVLAGLLAPGATAAAGAPSGGSDAPFLGTKSVTENALNVTTTYPVSEDSQAIRVTVIVSPDSERITNISLNISNTESAFVAFDSFGITLEPSGATDVQESLTVRGGEKVQSYYIESLNPDERVVITFRAYPRTLSTDDKQVDAAHVRYHYLRNGIDVPGNQPGRVTAVADISESPVYRSQQLRTQITGMWIFIGAAIVVGLIGLGVGGFLFVRSRGDSGSGIERRDVRAVKSDMESLRAKLDARVGDAELVRDAEDIIDKLDNLL